MRPLSPMFFYKANSCGICHADFLCDSPAAELFSKHHSQQTEQSDDGWSRALYSNHSIQNANKHTYCKGNRHYLHRSLSSGPSQLKGEAITSQAPDGFP